MRTKLVKFSILWGEIAIKANQYTWWSTKNKPSNLFCQVLRQLWKALHALLLRRMWRQWQSFRHSGWLSKVLPSGISFGRSLPTARRGWALSGLFGALLFRCPRWNLQALLFWRLRGQQKQFQDHGRMSKPMLGGLQYSHWRRVQVGVLFPGQRCRNWGSSSKAMVLWQFARDLWAIWLQREKGQWEPIPH